MPSLKDLKNRIGSVKSTQKITSAMKMVAAAKLRKAQEQALASRPYTSLMDRVVSKISSKAIGSSIDLLSGKEIKTHLLVVFSADRGLCGGFNGSITRTVKSEIKKLKDDGINVKLLMVGKKSADALNRSIELPIALEEILDTTLSIREVYGLDANACSWALRNLAAATIFIADVIFCVDLTEPILFLRSFKEGINQILINSNYLSKILY